MRSNSALIVFLVTVVLGAAAAMVYTTQIQQPGEIDPSDATPVVGGPEIIGVQIENINNRFASSISVEVRGGATPVNLSDTLITLSAQNGSSDLRID